MKNKRGKRKSKGKNGQRFGKENTANASEMNSLTEKVKDVKSVRFQFSLVGDDHYSFYERTSVKLEAKKGCKSSECSTENEGVQTKSKETKGQHRSALPPLKDLTKSQQRKQLTRNACGQSKLDTTLRNDGNHRKENITSTSSEKSKTLASVSFVGIYDLDDMNNTQVNREYSVLNLDNEKKVERESDEDKSREQVEKTSGYVIQTLTLEGESHFNRKESLHNKLILPGIKQNKKFIGDKVETFQRRETLFKEREKNNRLPRLVHSNQRPPRIVQRFSKRIQGNRGGKTRTNHKSFEQVYLEREIPRLPLVLNGRITQF